MSNKEQAPGWLQAEETIRAALQSRKNELFAAFEQGYIADMKHAWTDGYAAGSAAGKAEAKQEGISEGEFRGRKQGIIYAALNLLRDGMPPDKVAKIAELPELIIRKLASDNGIDVS